MVVLCRQFLFQFCCLTPESTGALTWKKFQGREGKKRAVLEKFPSTVRAWGLQKWKPSLVGRKDVSSGSPALREVSSQKTEKMEATCLRMMLGSDVPPGPYVTSQTQNTFWIRPFHLQVNVNTDLIHNSTIYVGKLVEAFQCQVLLGKIAFHIQRRLPLSSRGNQPFQHCP